jgi:hypothetical protein
MLRSDVARPIWSARGWAPRAADATSSARTRRGWGRLRNFGKERQRAGTHLKREGRLRARETSAWVQAFFWSQMVGNLQGIFYFLEPLLLPFLIKHQQKWDEIAPFHLTPQPNTTLARLPPDFYVSRRPTSLELIYRAWL